MLLYFSGEAFQIKIVHKFVTQLKDYFYIKWLWYNTKEKTGRVCTYTEIQQIRKIDFFFNV